MNGETITARRLEQIGVALFGPRWQLALARAVGVSGRHMRYMAAGQRPVPAELEAKAKAWATGEAQRLWVAVAKLDGRRGQR